MGARPYIWWDPNHNADLIATGQRTFTVDDGDDLRKLAAVQIVPRNLGVGTCYFQQRAVDRVEGAAPEVGLRARNHAYMPENLTFWVADPVNGLPYPLSPDDVMGNRFIMLGHRIPLRGYLRTATTGLSGTLRTRWGDATVRNAGQTRGPYTGVALGALETEDPQAGLNSRYLLYSVHGKRALPAELWRHRGGYFNHVTAAQGEVVAVQAGIQEAQHRIVLSGGGPWQCDSYYHDGAAWQLLDSRNLNLVSGVIDPTEVVTVGWLFAAQTAITATPLGDLLPHYFHEIDVPGFEPWVLNRASWESRDLTDAMAPWVPHPGAGPSFGTPGALWDLLHSPTGSPHAPVNLRVWDDELGYAVEMGPHTRLFAQGDTETAPIKSAKMFPLVCSGSGWADIDCPFTAVLRLKMAGMAHDPNPVAFMNFGDIFNPAAAGMDNGIGLYKEGDQLIARMWNLGGWANAIGHFVTEEHQDEVLTLAIAWTGNRGADAGYLDGSLRVLVNGHTVAMIVVPRAPETEGTTHAEIGYTGDGVHSTDGWTGLFGGLKCFAAALTDEEIRRAFDDAEGAPYNLQFSTADAAAGRAAGWGWKATNDMTFATDAQSLALFRQSPWPGPAEPFGWLDDWPEVAAANAPPYDFSAITASAVTGVNPGADQLQCGGDLTGELPVGASFRVTGSTGLDGYWTVGAIVFAAGTTTITTVEDVLSAVADGQVEAPAVLTVDVDTYTTQWVQFWDLYFTAPAAATADETVDVINDYLQHAVTWERGGSLRLRSERQGSAAQIRVTGGSANAALGFPTAAVWGTDDLGWTSDLSAAIAGVFFEGSDLRGNDETFEWTYWYDTLAEAGAGAAAWRSWYEALHTCAIVNVVAVNKRLDVAGDQRAYFPDGIGAMVTGSTGNDGEYTVDYTVYSGGNTRIYMIEAVPSAVADGEVSPWGWHAAAESFDEGWDSDPLSTAAAALQWVPGNVRNGRIYGEPVTFPLEIPSGRNRLFVFSDTGGAVVAGLALTTTVHADAAALVADLNAQVAAQLPTTALVFGYEATAADEARIWFGWDGVAHLGAEEAYFAAGPGALADQDARRLLGFDRLAPVAAEPGRVDAPTGYYAGDSALLWGDDEVYGVDPWSYLRVESELETHDGYEFARPYSWPVAVWDVAVPDADQHERFKCEGWGGGAWVNPGTFAPTAGSFDVDSPATSAAVSSATLFPIGPFAGGETLLVRVDQGALQTITFAGGETTAADVAALINAQIAGAAADVHLGQCRLTTDTPGTPGYIHVTGGTANAALGFPLAEQQGTDNPPEDVEDFEEGW